MHRGTDDDRVARVTARGDRLHPQDGAPGVSRRYAKRRCARAARRALRREVDVDVSMSAVEEEIDAEGARALRREAIRKECSESILWDDYEWDVEWWALERAYDHSPDYDHELRAAREEARERAQRTARYLQGEDPERDDWEVATSREFERRDRRRRSHQKYHMG